MNTLAQFKNAGFTFTLNDSGFNVKPSGRLTEEQRQFLKAHKAEIMKQLREEQTGNVIITCFACRHFQSFNKHGRGAGSCAIHAPTGGVCHWHDNKHQCNRFEGKL